MLSHPCLAWCATIPCLKQQWPENTQTLTLLTAVKGFYLYTYILSLRCPQEGVGVDIKKVQTANTTISQSWHSYLPTKISLGIIYLPRRWNSSTLHLTLNNNHYIHNTELTTYGHLSISNYGERDMERTTFLDNRHNRPTCKMDCLYCIRGSKFRDSSFCNCVFVWLYFCCC